MRKIVYSWELEGDAPYIECQVGDDLLFIVNCKAEACTPHWVRELMWNNIFAIAESGPAPRRKQQAEAEVIPIEDLQLRRQASGRAHGS